MLDYFSNYSATLCSQIQQWNTFDNLKPNHKCSNSHVAFSMEQKSMGIENQLPIKYLLPVPHSLMHVLDIFAGYLNNYSLKEFEDKRKSVKPPTPESALLLLPT